MGVQEESTTWAGTLRRHIIPTGLGPCTVRVQPGTGSPASGTAEVYLHGAAGSWTSFEPLLAEASPRDRVLIDLPGWGESTEGARLELFGIEEMARAVTEVLNELGYPRWHLVGHSMGGFLALHIAAAWPERTASVASISATTFGVSEAVREPLRSLSRFPAFAGMRLLMRSLGAMGPAAPVLVRAVGATPVMGLLMSPFFADPAGISAGVIRGLGHDARPASFSAAARAVAQYDFDRWRGIRCPVLASRGDSDVFTSLSDLDRLAAMVPNVRTVAIPHCGHFANVEQPEQVKRLLEDLWSLWPNTAAWRTTARLPAVARLLM
jgi:pimeloyl-ACP methyl ester carboxylesterase